MQMLKKVQQDMNGREHAHIIIRQDRTQGITSPANTGDHRQGVR
jgi:hypothetical protein